MREDYNRPNYSNGDRPKENSLRESHIEKGYESMNRRTFLKATAILGATLGIGKIALDWFDNNKEDVLSPNKEKDGPEHVDTSHEEIPQEETPTEEQVEIAKDNSDVIGSTIEAQLKEKDKVILNIETKNALRQKWKESYAKKPADCPKEDKETGKNHLGLLQSMEKMQPWIAEMKAEFTKEGVPEEYAFLAIPESHFDVNANSRAMAKGPYQFTKGTAKLFELSVANGIDERCDPIKSARACARHLKYSYERFNNDWNLAFSDYNGRYTKKYAKFRPKKADRNYDDYLSWREGRINKYISQDNFEHEVEKRDGNLTKIAGYYGLSVEDIKKENEMKDDKIVVGHTLKLPATTSVKMFKLRDSLESLNYPEKFYAILDVMKDEELEKRFPSKSLEFDWKEVPKVAMVDFSHVVGKDEGLFAIARRLSGEIKKKNPKINISIYQIQGLIQKQNQISNPKKILPGQKLNVALPLEGGASLETIARDNNLAVSELKKINPSIGKEQQILSSGMKIRLPK